MSTLPDAGSLLDAARTATGLDDFGDDDLFGGDLWREGLDRLLTALDGEARLHELGVSVVGGELHQYLVNRLGIVDHHRRHPEVRERPIEPPIVIVGQARTGTTMLVDLLAQDPAHRVPQTWEVDQPLPPPQAATYLTDPRIAAADETFAMVDLVIPGFRAVHQMGAQLAQECVRITGSAFCSAIFPTQYRVPSYLDWLLHEAVDGGHVAASYRWHRRFLEVLQSQAPGERWLIKSPGHAWTLPQLIEEYPRAVLVQTHRDPASIIASTTSLIGVLRRLGSDEIDLPEIAEEFSELLLDGLNRTARARLDGVVYAGRAVDVAFDDLMTAPLDTVRRVYDAFAWPLTDTTAAAMQEFLDTHPREGAGHSYTFEATGLDRDAVHARTAPYIEHFAVAVG